MPKNWFKICIFTVDMTYFMSNVHDFDDNQIFWKFAEMVLCPSIPLQKFFLLQAVHMILKCPLNNFFWMTPYQLSCYFPCYILCNALLLHSNLSTILLACLTHWSVTFLTLQSSLYPSDIFRNMIYWLGHSFLNLY